MIICKIEFNKKTKDKLTGGGSSSLSGSSLIILNVWLL